MASPLFIRDCGFNPGPDLVAPAPASVSNTENSSITAAATAIKNADTYRGPDKSLRHLKPPGGMCPGQSPEPSSPLKPLYKEKIIEQKPAQKPALIITLDPDMKLETL
jgi:hypothetical protein